MAAAARASKAGVIILSCSDPRLNPYQIMGIDSTLGKCPDALSPRLRDMETGCLLLTGGTMVRNAGGRVFDAIRSLSVLQTIGDARTIVVMHHTG
jgi:carbonic anhydrase